MDHKQQQQQEPEILSMAPSRENKSTNLEYRHQLEDIELLGRLSSNDEADEDDEEEGDEASELLLNSNQFELPERQQEQQRQIETQLKSVSSSRDSAGESTGKSSNNNKQQQQQQKDYDEVKQVELFGVSIVALTISGRERLCLAQISNTLLKEFSYNEIHNRRVALGITCVQCTPIQLEMLRRAGAMPSSSRRCGMITMREAERLCRSFLVEEQPPELPENFYFTVAHRVNYGCKGRFVPARYISSRAKCIECFYCGEFYSPNKFIFHSHRQPHNSDCNPPDSPNINSWRKHIDLDWSHEQSQEIKYAWEDVKSLFNGGTRRRATAPNSGSGLAGGTGSGGGSLLAASSQVVSLQQSTGRTGPGRLRNKQQHLVVSPESASLGTDEQLIDVDDSASSASKLSDCAIELLNSSPSSRNKITTTWPHQQVVNLTQIQQRNESLMLNYNGGQTQSNRSLTAASRKRHQNQCGPSHLNTLPEQTCKRFAAPTCTDNNTPVMAAASNNIDQTTNQQQRSKLIEQSSIGHLDIPNRCLSSSLVRQQAHQHLFHSFAQQQQQQQQLVSSATNKKTQPPQQPPVFNKSPLPLTYSSNNNNSSFIYSQLYSQLMQPHQQQQQQTTDAQLALRHHLWTSLLTNLQATEQNHTIAPASNNSNLSQCTNPSNTLIGNLIQETSSADPIITIAQNQLQANQLSHLISSQFYSQQQQQQQQQQQTNKISRHPDQNLLDPYKTNPPSTIRNAHFHQSSSAGNS